MVAEALLFAESKGTPLFSLRHERPHFSLHRGGFLLGSQIFVFPGKRAKLFHGLPKVGLKAFFEADEAHAHATAPGTDSGPTRCGRQWRREAPAGTSPGSRPAAAAPALAVAAPAPLLRAAATGAAAKDYFVFRSDGTNLYEQGRSLNVS